MGFSIPITRVKSDDIDNAIKEARQGAYTGPTPPPGAYRAQIKKVFTRESKAGKPALNVLFVLVDDGDNAVYNGCSIFSWYSIPVDPSERSFAIQVSSLDDMLMSLSGGTLSYADFVKIANDGKIVLAKPNEYDPTKNNEVTKIGPLKITGEQEATVYTKMGSYNGKEKVELHYLVDVPTGKTAAAAPPVDDAVFGNDDDDSDEDFDNWMNDDE